MAGSIKWFKYTTDAGDVFGVRMDESNGEAVGNEDYAALDAGTVQYALPRNVRPRTALYRSTDGVVSRRIIIGRNDQDITTLPTSLNVAAIDGNIAYTLSLQSVKGEETKRLTSVDTGLDDGDLS